MDFDPYLSQKQVNCFIPDKESSHTKKFREILDNLSVKNPNHPLILLSQKGPDEIKEALHKEMGGLYRQMERYGLGMSSNFELVDLETMKLVRTNHLMCMLKKDYKSDLFNTTKLYEWLVLAAIEGYQLAVQSPDLPESEKKDFEVLHEYL